MIVSCSSRDMIVLSVRVRLSKTVRFFLFHCFLKNINRDGWLRATIGYLPLTVAVIPTASVNYD